MNRCVLFDIFFCYKYSDMKNSTKIRIAVYFAAAAALASLYEPSDTSYVNAGGHLKDIVRDLQSGRRESLFTGEKIFIDDADPDQFPFPGSRI